MIRSIEVEINLMRRFACQCAKLDEFGHCYPLESLYCGTPRFSTVHRVSRAKLVGHILRHSLNFKHLMKWKSRETPRTMSPAEACIRDLGITLEEALVYSQDRDHWRKLCDTLHHTLEPLPDYTRVKTSQWKSLYKRAVEKENLYDLQFLEEGSDPFPIRDKEVYIYIDASVRSIRVTQECRSGAGLVIRQKWTRDKFVSLRLEATSAEQAEAQAFYEAFKRTPPGIEAVMIHTDSFYVWNFFHYTRLRRRVIGYEKVPNGKLLKDLDFEIRSLQAKNIKCYVSKVKSHNGNPHNEKADALALARFS